MALILRGVAFEFRSKDENPRWRNFWDWMIFVGSFLPALRLHARCRTTVPHIFAVGDVIGGLMLAHTAGQQGRVAAMTILGEDMQYDQDMDSGVIFSRPEAAFVGLSVEQAKARGIDAVEVKVPMNIDAKAMINNETHGMIKIVADKATHRVIDVHLLADHADTLIGEAVMMVSASMTLEQVGEAIHPHPTLSETLMEAAEVHHGVSPHIYAPKRK